MTFLRSKSLWKEPSRTFWEFICPLCRVPRRVTARSQPAHPKTIFQIASIAVFFTILCWKNFHWRGIFCFIPFWTFFELIYRWRLRALLPCEHCGFDPYLFAQGAQVAKREIVTHWRNRCAEKGIPYPEKDPAGPRQEASGDQVGRIKK